MLDEPMRQRVREMTASERSELRRYLDGLAQFDRRAGPAAISWIAPVFQAECVRLGLGYYLAVRARAGLSRHHEPLETFLAAACPGADLATRRAVLATGIEQVYHALRRSGKTVSPSILADNLHRLPAALDNAFPGYAQLGLLGKIVRKD